MRVLVIPDVHQTEYWKLAFKLPGIDAYDHIVQTGDWFDNFHPDWTGMKPVTNFLDAVEVARKNPRFKILVGNHDMSYVFNDGCSGHQHKHAGDIRKVLCDNHSMMSAALVIGGWTFSHAGLTKTWMRSHEFGSVEDINKRFHDIVTIIGALGSGEVLEGYSVGTILSTHLTPMESVSSEGYLKKRENCARLYPKVKEIISRYAGYEVTDDDVRRLHGCKIATFSFNGINCYGDDVTQGPLWVRPNSLVEDCWCEKQVVGHTEIDNPRRYRNDIIVMDNPDHRRCIELDTDTGKIKVLKP